MKQTLVGILLLAAMPMAAQSGLQKLKTRIDSMLNIRYLTVKYDTAYIGRPKERLTLKLRSNISGSDFNVKHHIDGNDGHYRLSTDHKATVSVGASYMGISAGLALNPASLKGKSKDYELNINAYSNRYGIDFIYQESQTLSGSITFNGVNSYLEKGMADMRVIILDGYYAFNGHRFSYPAAFTQSYIQKRSAGSLLLGFSYMGCRIKTTDEIPAEDDDQIIRVGHFGIGGGYGYNLVAWRRLLLHLSVLPTLVVINYNNVEIDGNRRDMDTQFPDFIFTERASIVYQFNSRCFAGATFVLSNSLIDASNRMEISYSKWRLRAFVGVRF
jgi:hypothetical protein